MKIDFNKGNGLVPVIIQDYLNMQVLMLGYMNEEAFNLTQKSGIVTFYSRSKNRIWQKGETSNNRLLVKKIDVDCDNDTLLILAQPMGPTCHTGSKSCFKTAPNNGFLFELEELLLSESDDSVLTTFVGFFGIGFGLDESLLLV